MKNISTANILFLASGIMMISGVILLFFSSKITGALFIASALCFLGAGFNFKA